MQTQPLLFSEPSYSETAVWCELAEGVDPAKWARICRAVGTMPSDAFERFCRQSTSQKACSQPARQQNTQKKREATQIPLISIDPGGIGAGGQWEI